MIRMILFSRCLQRRVFAIALVLTLPAMKPLMAQEVNLDLLLPRTVAQLTAYPGMELDIEVKGGGFLAEELTPVKARMWVAPQRNPDAFGFDNARVMTFDDQGRMVSELTKAGDDIYRWNPKDQVLEHSTIYRLGAPLWSTSVGQTMLAYQFLPVLRDYAEYKPVVGASALIGEEESVEVIFDLPEYDFFVRFWIGTTTFQVKRIVQKQTRESADGPEVGFVDYTILSLTGSEFMPPEVFVPAGKGQFPIREFSAGGPVIGDQAPGWTLTSLDGSQEISLESLKGKIVVLDFWATWCLPCKEAMPAYDQLHERYADQPVEFIAVTYKEVGSALEWSLESGLHYTFLEGTPETGKAYGLDAIGIPTLYVIGEDGKVVEFESGFLGDKSVDRLRNVLDKLVAKE